MAVTSPLISQFCGCAAANNWPCIESMDSFKLQQRQFKGPPRIACTNEGGIGSKRRGRRGGRKDPRLDEKESVWPFLEIQERMIKDCNKQVLVDAEILLAQSNNKFGLVLEISEEANEYLRHNKDESLTRKPVLKVISDRINQGAGEDITDSYIEETFDPTE